MVVACKGNKFQSKHSRFTKNYAKSLETLREKGNPMSRKLRGVRGIGFCDLSVWGSHPLCRAPPVFGMGSEVERKWGVGNQMTPCAIMAFATFMNPATLAPFT